MEPGIYPGMKRGDYERIEAVNYSTLKHFRRTAAHVREYSLHPPEPTPALDLGTAIHCVVLEPERFEAEYIVAPKVDRRTKAGKDQWATFEEANRGKELLSLDDMETCRLIADAVGRSETASRLLSSPGKNEIAAVWDDPKTGIRCKALMDRFTVLTGWSVVLDLKSTTDAGPDAFARDCARFEYHTQAAFYLDGLNVLAPTNRRFIHIAVEKDRPHCVATYELDPPSLAEGRIRARQYLRDYVECVRSGFWPGYEDGVVSLSLPRWAISEEALHVSV